MSHEHQMACAATVQAETGWMAPSAALAHFNPLTLSAANAAAPHGGMARYGYLAAGLRLLVKPAIRSEVIAAPTVWPIPNGPGWLSGVLNLRSHLIPVFDLDRIFGMTPAKYRKPMTLVLGQGETAVGFGIEGHPAALRNLKEAAVPATLPSQLASHVPAAWMAEEALWLEFDHEGLFESIAAETAAG